MIFSRTTTSILIGGFFLYSCILFSFVRNDFLNHKEYILYRLSEKLSSIEATINSEISHANHILYGLASSISEEATTKDHSPIKKLIQNFDPKLNLHQESPPSLAGMSFLDHDGSEVINTVIPDFHRIIQNKIFQSTQKCLNEASNEFFKIKVSPIRMEDYVKEQIIPINIRIEDSKHNEIGLICSGLSLKIINNRIAERFGFSKHINGVNIVNAPSSLNQHISSQNISTRNILISLITGKDIVVYHKLSKFPLYLEAKLKYNFVKQSIQNFTIFAFLILILFVLSLIFLNKKLNKNYILPLLTLQKKIEALEHMVSEQNTKINAELIIDQSNKFSIIHFTRSLENLMNIFYETLLEKLEKTSRNNEIQRKIMNLVFIEQHFMISQKENICKEKFYINKINSLVKEPYVNLHLEEFFKQFCEYCSVFYHELTITLIIEASDKRNFSFKQAALIETLFNIFILILRTEFDHEEPLIVKAKFAEDSLFPTISIEALLSKENSNTLGWEFGPYFTHTSLLSIYLLAAENQLLFITSQEENKIIFKLLPVRKELQSYKTK